MIKLRFLITGLILALILIAVHNLSKKTASDVLNPHPNVKKYDLIEDSTSDFAHAPISANKGDKVEKHKLTLMEWNERYFAKLGNTLAEQKARLLITKACSDDEHRSCTIRLKREESKWTEPRCATTNFNFALHLARDRPEAGFPVAFQLEDEKYYGVQDPLVTGYDMTAAILGKDDSEKYQIRLNFSERARAAILEGTDFNQNQAICLVIGGDPVSCPRIMKKLNTTSLNVSFVNQDEKEIERIFNTLCNGKIEIPDLPY